MLLFKVFFCLIIRNENNQGSGEVNPFEEDEWDDSGEVLVDNGEPGIPVRALYDYEGAESDELSFKQGGEIFLFVFCVCYIEISPVLNQQNCYL